ncbi:hypothetical protein HNP55_004522 [Paucibacter oligotrophus]|uniref:Uncharacterized protein n=1 Tax=Roseateles oligotrophus TaxID=1769250 RepID=A0A840LID5_9BURK|nr:hypothetical protein [Roseateles oligotrophus]MBB4845968.1 hypothetical protein [Roseateles oligotrophus]
MESPPSRLAKLAVAAFCALSWLGGWLVVHGGGFTASLGKRSNSNVFVDGPEAVVMALLQLSAAALALTWLLRLRLPPVLAMALALSLVFLPPLLYIYG